MTTPMPELALEERPQLLRERPSTPDARVRDRLADLLRLADRAAARGHRRLAAYYRERVVAEVWPIDERPEWIRRAASGLLPAKDLT